jgi:hypothetical protein
VNIESIVTAAGIGFIAVIGVLIVLVKMPKRLRAKYFVGRWQHLQGFCKDKQKWPKVLEDADKLLDRALKKRKFKGNSMGERMVSAQRTFTDNDGAWFAHNLYKKVMADPEFKLREADMKNALVGFRQALRDIGALPSEQSKERQ